MGRKELILYQPRFMEKHCVALVAIRLARSIVPAILVLTYHSTAYGQSDTRNVRQDLIGKSFQTLSGPCLVLSGLKNAIVENVAIGPCAEEGLVLIDSDNVLVRNLTVQNTGGAGIYVRGSKSITISSSNVTDGVTGISVLDSQGVNVECNSIRDVRGPIPAGQFIQFDKVTGSENSIACNSGLNTSGYGRPEDGISLYKSHGTPQSPIVVTGNLLVGGGPSESGGGIMVGDDGGSDILITGNRLLDPGQYGIGVASGNGISIVDNVVIGKQQPFTNVGIYVWNQYSHLCRDIRVSGNVVRWRSKTGSPNPWWDGGNCGVIAGIETNSFADFEPVSEPVLPGLCSCEATRE